MKPSETRELIKGLHQVHEMAFGKKPRRGRVPRPVHPSAIKAEYLKGIRHLVLDPLHQAALTLTVGMDEIVEEADRERGDTLVQRFGWPVYTRTDAASGKARALIQKIAEQYQKAVAGQDRLEELAARIGDRTSRFQQEQLRRQLKAALGVDPLLHEPPRVAKLLEGFTEENVALIKTVPKRFFAEVEAQVPQAVRAGMRAKDLAGIIAERYGVSETNAARIANDQIGKFYGALNQVRQTALGITSYIWHTVGDNRVRDEHDDREGDEFDWSDPPEDGHPGEPINCRCWPEPVLDDLL